MTLKSGQILDFSLREWASCLKPFRQFSAFVLLSLISLFFFNFLHSGNLQAGLIDFSIQEEKELGQKFNVLIRSQFPVIYDPVLTEYLDGLLQTVSAAMPPQPFPLSITLIKDKTLNAFAAPAGYLFVHSGLVLAMKQEAELAGVIAHELAHVSQRHLAERIEQSKLIAIGTIAGMLAGAMLGGGGDLGRAISMGSMAGGQAAALKYTRDHEREADQIGLNYMLGCGFDPKGLLFSFKRIQQHNLLGGVSRPPAYMLTHPGIPERIHYLEDRLSRQPASQGLLMEETGKFETVQMLIRSKYAEADQAITYYHNRKEHFDCLDFLGYGIALERQNRVKEAEHSFEQALQCHELGPLVRREYGRFLFLIGKYREGLVALNQALSSNPDDYLSLYYKARILTESGKSDQARKVLERILVFLPEVSEVHELLGQVYGRKGDAFMGFLHLAYGALFQNKEKQTEHYIQKLQPLAATPDQKQALERFLDRYRQRKEFW